MALICLTVVIKMFWLQVYLHVNFVREILQSPTSAAHQAGSKGCQFWVSLLHRVLLVTGTLASVRVLSRDDKYGELHLLKRVLQGRFTRWSAKYIDKKTAQWWGCNLMGQGFRCTVGEPLAEADGLALA